MNDIQKSHRQYTQEELDNMSVDELLSNMKAIDLGIDRAKLPSEEDDNDGA